MDKIYFLIMLFGMMNTAYALPSNQALSLSSSSFADQMTLQTQYTCDGKNVSPQIAWANPPAKTQSFVLIMSDPDAPHGTFYHWIIFNLPANTKELPKDFSSKLGVIGQNDMGHVQYNGPCPPKGSTHSYVFTLYALDSTLDFAHVASAQEVIAAMKDHILGQAEIRAKYGR